MRRNPPSEVLDFGIKRLDLARIRELPNLVKVVPLRDTEQRVVRGDVRAQASAIATTPDVFDVISLPLQRGRYFSEIDAANSAAVCVIGANVCKQLFPFQDPLGETIEVGSSDSGAIILEVVGVLEPTGLRTDGSGGMIKRNLDQDLYFPLSLGQRAFGDAIMRRQAGTYERKNVELSEIWIQTKSIEDVESTALIAENVMQLNHKRAVDFEVKAPDPDPAGGRRAEPHFQLHHGGNRGVCAGGRRHRDHEHHAGDGDRAGRGRSASAALWAPSAGISRCSSSSRPR